MKLLAAAPAADLLVRDWQVSIEVEICSAVPETYRETAQWLNSKSRAAKLQ